MYYEFVIAAIQPASWASILHLFRRVNHVRVGFRRPKFWMVGVKANADGAVTNRSVREIFMVCCRFSERKKIGGRLCFASGRREREDVRSVFGKRVGVARSLKKMPMSSSF